jgi:hypothetical protein
LPIIHYSIYFTIPFLNFLFLSGFGIIYIVLMLKYNVDDEFGSFSIRFGKEHLQPSDEEVYTTPNGSRPPTPHHILLFAVRIEMVV